MDRCRPCAAMLLLCLEALLVASVPSACGTSSTDTAAATTAASAAASAAASLPASTAASPSGPDAVGDQLNAGPWQSRSGG
jgi:hypothetical protein